MNENAPEIDALRDEVKRLRGFVAALFEASDWPNGGDISVFDFQDLCEAHGILVPETRTEPCCDDCSCAEYHGEEGMRDGVRCLRKPQWLLKAMQRKDVET